MRCILQIFINHICYRENSFLVSLCLSRFLYQVFPGNSFQCQRLLYKAAKNGELESVKKLVSCLTELCVPIFLAAIRNL